MSPKHRQRCQQEITRDVIFLLRWKTSQRQERWEVDSVWLDRDEAEAFRKAHLHRWNISHVYGVPTYGKLATLLQNQDKVLEDKL